MEDSIAGDDIERYAQNIFLEVDINNDRKLDPTESEELLNRLNLRVTKDHAQRLF